jgi:serine/threonine protein kinase
MDGTRLSLETGRSTSPADTQENVTVKEDVNEALDLLRKRLNIPGKRTLEVAAVPGSKRCPVCSKVYSAGERFCSADSSPLETSAGDNLIGQILGGSYQVLGIVGVGGNSQVYKAKHVFLGRTVAIKVLHASQVGNDEQVKRFLQESRAVSSLHHDNIVSLYDFGLTDDGRPFLVMDYLEGTTLFDLVKANGPLEPVRVINIFRQVCDALDHAHKKGIVHRDVKPGNIVLLNEEDRQDVVKLVDFGLVKIMSWASVDSFHHTQQGTVCGSPLYMSPEQCADKTIDARSDIYSLGASLYEALCGQPPFAGESMAALMVQHLHEAPRPLLEVVSNGKISRELNDLVMKTLSKDPEQRQQSMNEVLQELEIVAGTRKERTAPNVAPQRKERTSVLVVDDDEVSLLACAMAINMQADLEIVGVAINGELAVQKVQELRPDIVIMDLELPVVNGVEATRMIRERCPETKVMILSSHNDRAGVLEAFSKGAMAYVLKSLPGERFFSSIRTVALGSFWVDDGLPEDLVYEARQLVYETFRRQNCTVTLSCPEADLITLWLEGMSDADVCSRLGIREDLLHMQKQRLWHMFKALRANN